MSRESADSQLDAELRIRIERTADRFKTRKDAAVAAGVSADQLQRYIRGENAPSLSVATRLADAAGVSVEWLATGRGSMERGVAEAGAAISGAMQGAARRWERADVPAGFVLVPRYDVRASAGAGALNDDANIKDYLAFRESWIRVELGTSPKEVLCMNAIGDSMEPAIRTGDVLLVDRAITKVADEAIYVVALEDALLLKRVQPLLGGVVLRSDNPAYGPVSLTSAEAEQLSVFGRVRWYGRVI